MSFFADKQTLNDLNIPGRHKNNSVSRLFDTVVTAGGRKLIDDMFQRPLIDAGAINKRSSIFKYFTHNPIAFPFNDEEFGVMENYLSSGGGNYAAVALNAVSKKILQVAAQDKEYELLNAEVCKTIELLNRFYVFIATKQDQQSPYYEQAVQVKNIFANTKMQLRPSVAHRHASGDANINRPDISAGCLHSGSRCGSKKRLCLCKRLT
jgi:DNA mismatch repair protein MutS